VARGRWAVVSQRLDRLTAPLGTIAAPFAKNRATDLGFAAQSGMTTMLAVGMQVLLALSVEGQPVRFGVPLPAPAVAQGLRLCGPGVLQWRRLPVGRDDADPVWVELAVAGTTGRVRIAAGGAPATPDGHGAAFVREQEEQRGPEGKTTIVRWRWCDGRIDERRRTQFEATTTIAGETYSAGEARTVWNDGRAQRATPVVHVPRRIWELAAVLPAGGRLGEAVRKQLAAVRPRLVEMAGERGAGDFERSQGIVTNLEYDTTLGLLRLALVGADEAALAQALRCAQHLCDRDFDLRSGLPFTHGLDHRTGVPAPGHAWLQGLLLAGLLAADDDLIAAARAIGRGLATHPPTGTDRFEVARDHAWPLLELEGLLAVLPDRALAQAADRLAVSIDRRFDPIARTYRFGEGELGDGVYLERGWITGGLVVPALVQHLQRCPDARMAEHVRIVRQALQDQIGLAGGGIPTHWRCANGQTYAVHRAQRDPAAMLMLDALELVDLRRLSRRETLRRSVEEVPNLEDPDLPTAFSMVARCTWVWR
jgi:hypothetical protein